MSNSRPAGAIFSPSSRREIELFEQALVAVDGSKFKAVNNRDKNFTPHKLQARQRQLDESVARYLADLDRADRDPSPVPEERTEHLKEKLATVRARTKQLEAIGRRLTVAPDEQVSLTDPDARSMATSGRGTGVVGYNDRSPAVEHLRVGGTVSSSPGVVAARSLRGIGGGSCGPVARIRQCRIICPCSASWKLSCSPNWWSST